MTVQLLIDAIVRQVTVLIAQLATSGGIRAPLSHVANQVFVDLANELTAQGISRKVSADMFGMALRAYIRKLRRLGEGRTDQGRTLWQAVLEFIREHKMLPRTRLLERFERDGELELSAILHDLVDSGLVFCSGTGKHAVYRAADDQELAQLSRISEDEGLDEMLWALIFREGPVSVDELALRLSRPAASLAEPVERLCRGGRVRRLDTGKLHAQDFLVPQGAAVGWEAAVFDHVQAAVQTICQRLQSAGSLTPERSYVGGSTYTFDVWNGHPLQKEVRQQLEELRDKCGQLRQRVSDHNAVHGVPGQYEQITTYIGQCAIERETGEN
jgi:predicted transcriptional regulator